MLHHQVAGSFDSMCQMHTSEISGWSESQCSPQKWGLRLSSKLSMSTVTPSAGNKQQHQIEPDRLVNMRHHALRREWPTPSTVFSACYPAGAVNSASTGMLVVDSIVPGSFAEGLLEPGDIITKVEGKVVTHFLALEDTLDSSVGATVTLNVERGGQPLQATIKVPPPVWLATAP
jgi:hypothetical protein